MEDDAMPLPDHGCFSVPVLSALGWQYLFCLPWAGNTYSRPELARGVRQEPQQRARTMSFLRSRKITTFATFSSFLLRSWILVMVA